MKIKKAAKIVSWRYLRLAQRNILITYDGRVDPESFDLRKLMVSFATYIFILIEGAMYEKWDENTVTKFRENLNHYAPKDIKSLLAEFKLPQLDKNEFIRCFNYMIDMMGKCSTKKTIDTHMYYMVAYCHKSLDFENLDVINFVDTDNGFSEMVIDTVEKIITNADDLEFKDGVKL